MYQSCNLLRALFTKFLTPGLTQELDNPLDDWLNWLIPTNQRAGYLIRRIIRELKIWWIRAYDFFQSKIKAVAFELLFNSVNDFLITLCEWIQICKNKLKTVRFNAIPTRIIASCLCRNTSSDFSIYIWKNVWKVQEFIGINNHFYEEKRKNERKIKV